MLAFTRHTAPARSESETAFSDLSQALRKRGLHGRKIREEKLLLKRHNVA